jgi:hypothetical protein
MGGGGVCGGAGSSCSCSSNCVVVLVLGNMLGVELGAIVLNVNNRNGMGGLVRKFISEKSLTNHCMRLTYLKFSERHPAPLLATLQVIAEEVHWLMTWLITTALQRKYLGGQTCR